MSNREMSEERSRREGDATNEAAAGGQSACLSNTQTNKSQAVENEYHRHDSEDMFLKGIKESLEEASLNIDWLEGTMCVQWSGEYGGQHVVDLKKSQEKAKEIGQPVRHELGDIAAYLHETGLGHGKQARMTYRFTVCGMTVGLAFRDKYSRHLPNLYYKIPGEVCLYYGAEESLEIIRSVVKFFHGYIEDDVVRRIDLAYDIPGLDINDWIIPAVQDNKFLTTSHFWDLPDGIDGKRSVIVGKRNSVRLMMYDKRFEAEKKHDDVYLHSVISRRWNGILPTHATRIEYQLQRSWLSKYGLDRVQTVIEKTPEIICRLTQPGRGRQFAITADKPDRKNNHQSRAVIDPRWEAIIQGMLEASGKPKTELQPIETKNLRLERVVNTVLGYMTTIAAKIGRSCDSIHDLCLLLIYMAELNEWTDQKLKEVCDRKRCELGTELLVLPDQNWDVPF